MHFQAEPCQSPSCKHVSNFTAPPSKKGISTKPRISRHTAKNTRWSPSKTLKNSDERKRPEKLLVLTHKCSALKKNFGQI
jgi:hypothetical protein